MHATDKHEPMTWDRARAIAEQSVKQPYKARKARTGSDLYVVTNTETGWTDDRHLPRSLAIEDARKMNGGLIGEEMLRLMRERNSHRRPAEGPACTDIAEFARANQVAMVPDAIGRVRRRINAIAPDASRHSRAGHYSRSALDALDDLERLVSGLLEGEKPPILAPRPS